MTTIGLVVPVFEEAVRFAEYGKVLVEHVESLDTGSRLVFVDDGSADGTAEQIGALLAEHPDAPAELVRRPHLGKGAAVAAGIAALGSSVDVVAFSDLDLSTPLHDVQRLVDLAAAAPSATLVIGSRDLATSRLVRREGRVRETLGRAYNRLLQLTVTPGIVDTQCGAKAARPEVWADVLRHCRQQGFAWDAEVVAVALALGIEVQEVAIEWRHDDRSKINVGRDGLAMVAETGRIWRSAARAAAAGATGRRPTPVFSGTRAESLAAVDGRHWWFRAKAACVATALRRTAPPASADLPPLLLDVGAGGGGVTSMLGWSLDRVVAVEGAETLVAYARRRHGLDAVRADAGALPVAAGVAAVVTLLDVIEHVDDPVAALQEAVRAIGGHPAGRVVVTVPALPQLWSPTDAHLGHRLRYDRRRLHEELAAAGLRPVLTAHLFPWLVPFLFFERRRHHRHQLDATGLGRTSFLIDRTALVLTAVERLLVGRLSLPFGTTLLCVAVPNGASDGE